MAKKEKIQKNKSKKENFEKSEIAVRYNIRVSKPYLYYPEDVDKILTDLDSRVKSMAKEVESLAAQKQISDERLNKLQAEYSQLQLQISMFRIDDSEYDLDIPSPKKPGFKLNKKIEGSM